MDWGNTKRSRWMVGLVGALALTAGAQERQHTAHNIEVPLNKSRVVTLDFAPKKVSVGNEAIADIRMMQSRQLYVLGKQLGSTNLILWNGRNEVAGSIDVQVTHDLELLKRKLYELLPGERIGVHASKEAIVMTGEVSSAPKMDMALQLARSTIRRDGNAEEDVRARVLNMMQVGGAKQVLLEVKVAEVARTFMKRMESNFSAITADGNLSIGTITGAGEILQFPIEGAGAEIPSSTLLAPGSLTTNDLADPRVIPTGGNSLVASFLDGTTLSTIVIDAAKEEGLAKVLAEPTLTTSTGKIARFHAGGEFPLPVPGEEDSVTIEYKKFGVNLGFLPVVLDSGQISLDVDIEVSELSNQNAVALEVPGVSTSFFIPSLTMRQASSTVELAGGQTIGIAGLINENLSERVNKFPGLGDIPVLGALFRSQEFIKGQTELVIFVTPRFAHPIDPEMVRLPTDSFVEPGDAEFYLLGRLQGSRKDEKGPEGGALVGSSKGGIEGRFGHEL
ncbi:type II and III secretion system protein family protein [Thiohalomonas denitrificans]|uniref:type II and III secretion system protein family protein n=1 Tax=Thiohalomonas denitrificans TaxID=415747 RepID=UPI0026ED1B92|nr:type II and III secretion system protein family protein [Thiohalomonas denitrificans]